MKNMIALALAGLVVVINAFIGHYYPHYGIFLMPKVLLITSLLVCFGTKHLRLIYLSILNYFFIGANDILIKLYLGGTHDSEGRDVIGLFMFIGIILSSICLLVAICLRNNEKVIIKIIAFLLFAGLLLVHEWLFGYVGTPY